MSRAERALNNLRRAAVAFTVEAQSERSGLQSLIDLARVDRALQQAAREFVALHPAPAPAKRPRDNKGFPEGHRGSCPCDDCESAAQALLDSEEAAEGRKRSPALRSALLSARRGR